MESTNDANTPSCEIIINSQEFAKQIFVDKLEEYVDFNYTAWLIDVANNLQRILDEHTFDDYYEYDIKLSLQDIISVIKSARVIVKL